MTNERRGFAECASSAAAFGSVGVLVALAQREHVGTTTLLASRYALGALALWVALLFIGRPLPSLRIGLIAVALGATTYAAASATYLASIERMGAGPAGVVSYCYPVLVMAGAIMLGRERLSRRPPLAGPPRSASRSPASACSSPVADSAPSTSPARCSPSPRRASTRRTC